MCRSPLRQDLLMVLEGVPSSAQGLPSTDGQADEMGMNLHVVECTGCGLVQLDSAPVPYYRDVIRAAVVSAVLREEKRAQYAEFIRAYQLEGRTIMEVGAGRGEFLTILREFPVQAVGLEHAEDSVRTCRAAGLQVDQGFPQVGMPIPPWAPCDAFLLHMFLEHMPDPTGTLRAMAELLRPGAVGLVEVPNFDAMAVQAQVSEFVADHLLYFTQRTLALTLALGGFDVLDLQVTRNGYVLAATVRRRVAADLSAMHRAREQLRASLQAFIDDIGAGRVAVWGAGHQALTVLAMTGVAPAVRYVVDSAPFKQGRYTPVTHRPIVSPAMLQTDPVDGVIVMAGGYSDEVAAILAREYPACRRVAILRDSALVAWDEKP